MKSSRVLKTELFILRIGKNIEYTCVCAKHSHINTFINDEVSAMAWMWTCAGVQATEFNKAMNQLRRNKHSHAHFSNNQKLFLYTDNESVDG